MLDIVTARVVLAIVALCVLVLFFFGPFRATRSRFTLWWCLALVAAFLSTAAFLFNGTPLQIVMNPLGSVLAVVGTTWMCASARAVAGRPRPRWVGLGAALVVAAAAAMDDPANNVWAGGAVMLAGMAAGMLAGSWELVRIATPGTASERARPGRGERVAVVSLAIASAMLGLFYLVRMVAFLVGGPAAVSGAVILGSATTSVLLTLVLVVATYSVSELSHFELTRDLRTRAAHDDLTGLLSRSEFLVRAAEHRRTNRGDGAVAIVADLDHFKELNDEHGHAAGDRALLAFGAACRSVTAGRGIAGRIGGEEFAILLAGRNTREAVEVTETISAQYVAAAREVTGGRAPTVSYGIAVVPPGEPLDRVLARADAALYRAKREGRDRAVVED